MSATKTDRYLVTGGAGFIGSNLVDGILARGGEVVVLDDLSSGSLGNLAHLEGDARLRFVEGSILDPGKLADAISGCRFVHHLAAVVSVPESIEDPLRCHEVDATGTLRVFEAARAAGVERVVYSSSCALYGNEPSMPKSEASPLDPQSPYAVAKLAGERYAEVYTKTMGLDVVSLRYFNVFGPRQSPTGGYAAVIPIFCKLATEGASPTIFGDGLQTRDFVFVDNVVAANLAALDAEGAPGMVFNIGTGVQTSLLDLLEGIGSAVGRTITPEFGPAREGDVRHSVADVSRARRVLGYDPGVDLREGLARTLRWHQEAR